MSTVDFAVVGAGPAGMAAATLAAQFNLETLLIDEQDAPGGQIYRAVERARPDSPLGADFLAGRTLVAAMRASGIVYRPATTLWHLEPEGRLYLVADGRADTVSARRILLATGAIERPVPIPGWTLPGVMTVGGAQTLLKSADLTPSGRVVLAGQGPLLYLLAMQLTRAGAPPTAILDTMPLTNYRHAVAPLIRRWPGGRALLKGLRWILATKCAGIRIRRAVRGLRAIGRSSLERVAWRDGEIAADHLLLHEGLIPNIHVGLALQLRHEWDEEQLCWRPVLDPWGQSSLPCIAIAGDGGAILGAEAACLSGQLAALDAAMLLGRLNEAERDRRAKPIRARLAREHALHAFLDRLYRPPPSVLVPDEDETIVCRCEEVAAADIRQAARLGAVGPNQVKAFTRCGMGPCQGRICGPIVGPVIADTLGRPIGEIGTWRARAPYKPITVGTLAELSPAD